jgi:hypothetical protein
MNNQTLKQNLFKIFLLKKSTSSTLYVIWKRNNKKMLNPSLFSKQIKYYNFIHFFINLNSKLNFYSLFQVHLLFLFLFNYFVFPIIFVHFFIFFLFYPHYFHKIINFC